MLWSPMVSSLKKTRLNYRIHQVGPSPKILTTFYLLRWIPLSKIITKTYDWHVIVIKRNQLQSKVIKSNHVTLWQHSTLYVEWLCLWIHESMRMVIFCELKLRIEITLCGCMLGMLHAWEMNLCVLEIWTYVYSLTAALCTAAFPPIFL